MTSKKAATAMAPKRRFEFAGVGRAMKNECRKKEEQEKHREADECLLFTGVRVVLG